MIVIYMELKIDIDMFINIYRGILNIRSTFLNKFCSRPMKIKN